MSPMLALYSWPAISALILRKLHLPLAILVIIIMGYMVLPPRFAIDFPMVPPMDKNVIPVLTATLLTFLMASRVDPSLYLKGYLPRNSVALGLIALLIFGSIGTAMTNGDRIVTPLEVKDGLTLYEGFSMMFNFVFLLLPVLVGRKYFARPEMHRLILIVLCLAACAYAFLALYEVRMSPRLNRVFYGFTPHSWVQHIRGDGFRPMVFMAHGLRVALFFALSLIAAVGLFRVGWKTGPIILVILWLGLTLVFCKSLGAIMIALLIIPMVLFLSTRALILAAAIIGFMVLAYPMLRGSGYAPVGPVISVAHSINPQRAESFAFRLENEDILLERANQRPMFGWGGFGRSFVRNEKGIDITVPDGYWVIIIGKGGWSRYIGEFGLMMSPMLFLFFYRRRMDISRETAVLSIMLAGNMIDLIPNSGLTPITWLITGALWGRLELGTQAAGLSSGSQQDNTPPEIREAAPRYARDFGTPPPQRHGKNAASSTGAGRTPAASEQGRYSRYAKDRREEPESSA